MTGWDILDKFITGFPPIAATALLVAVAVIFIVGFSRRGLNFIKYGFGKIALDETLGKRFDRLEERLDSMDARFDGMEKRLDGMDARLDSMDARLNGMDARFDGMDARLDSMDARLDGMDARFDGMEERLGGMDARFAAIEINHFGHLKNFLSELTSILLDKGIINNTDKARLDNQLRDM
jgi:archaellum component FlaC